MKKPSQKPWRAGPQVKHNARLLRRTLTPAEQKLWSVLRNRQLDGFHFRRQHPIQHYVVDFCCLREKLVIEVDGDTHAEQQREDLERTRYLEALGYRVIRFTNREVLHNLESVLDEIRRVLLEGADAQKACLDE
jgi:very-short-patch-repair endonuclease